MGQSKFGRGEQSLQIHDMRHRGSVAPDFVGLLAIFDVVGFRVFEEDKPQDRNGRTGVFRNRGRKSGRAAGERIGDRDRRSNHFSVFPAGFFRSVRSEVEVSAVDSDAGLPGRFVQ